MADILGREVVDSGAQARPGMVEEATAIEGTGIEAQTTDGVEDIEAPVREGAKMTIYLCRAANREMCPMYRLSSSTLSTATS